MPKALVCRGRRDGGFLHQPAGRSDGALHQGTKEQAIYGRQFRTVDEVREAVESFVNLYNSQWRVEKNGFMSPHEIGQAA